MSTCAIHVLRYLCISQVLFLRLKLKALHRFENAATAVEEMSALQEGKLGKGLKKFLSDEIVDKGKTKESLAVIDNKLGTPH